VTTYLRLALRIRIRGAISIVCRSGAARSEARALIGRTLDDRGFESRLRHGCLSWSFHVVLFCVGRDLATS
jgi:hypothetical protein